MAAAALAVLGGAVCLLGSALVAVLAGKMMVDSSRGDREERS